MKRILLFFGVVSSFLLNGQVSIQANIPATIDVASELPVEIKISKGAITNFAKYQMDLPEGVTAAEGDSKGGTFAFENSRVKIIWPNIQPDREITITLKLMPGAYAGPAKITQKFYYMDGGEKKEAEAEALSVTFKGSTIKSSGSTGQPDAQSKSTVNQQTEKLQAEQLKRDSKDAYQTGLKEQEAAERKLAEADEAIKKAEALANEEEKNAALQKANANKQKAQNDKAVASKILMLAKSLDDNANEIDRLNKAAAAAGTGTSSASPAATAPAVVADNGTVYRVQLGAFSQNPEKILYKHMGTISIVHESGMYKVLMGKYATREEAAVRRDELAARSFDCFIVTYRDGVRVK